MKRNTMHLNVVRVCSQAAAGFGWAMTYAVLQQLLHFGRAKRDRSRLIGNSHQTAPQVRCRSIAAFPCGGSGCISRGTAVDVRFSSPCACARVKAGPPAATGRVSAPSAPSDCKPSPASALADSAAGSAAASADRASAAAPTAANFAACCALARASIAAASSAVWPRSALCVALCVAMRPPSSSAPFSC